MDVPRQRLLAKAPINSLDHLGIYILTEILYRTTK
jgi:hypothetical protein